MEKKYTDFDAINFAEDPSFVRWIRHKTPESVRFWNKWQQDHPDKQAIVKEAKILVQAIQIKETTPSDERINQLWDKIDAATSEEQTSIKKEATVRSMRPMRWIAYAAAACVAGLLFFQLYNPSTTVQIGNGQHLAHQLPDESQIELNADSKITYKSKDWSKERIVNLEGEAFFEVEKGASFKVITANGTVEVLGTSFNVNARNGNLIVGCKTGKVQVSAKGDKEILTPGKGTQLNTAKTALVDVYMSDIAQQTGWRNGQFYFENTSLETVVQELERQFDVMIKVDQDLINKVGNYSFKGNLTEALEDVTYQLNATSFIDGRTVELKKK